METSPKTLLTYGGVPVPYTSAWSLEEAKGMMYVGRCPYARRTAIMQRHLRGQGKPRFAKPHAERQREAVAKGLCDLCGRPLAARTKISLSQARSQVHAVDVGDVLQVEPLLHKVCACISLAHCPDLQNQIKAGRLNIRQVLSHRVQFAAYNKDEVFKLTGERVQAISHAKVQLVRWVDRDFEWLLDSESSKAKNDILATALETTP